MRPAACLQILQGRFLVKKNQAGALWAQGNPLKPSAGELQRGAGILENVPAAEFQEGR